MPDSSKKLKVLLCHPSGKNITLQELYENLRLDGFAPWLESDLVPPGADWGAELQKTILASHAVIVCHSADPNDTEERLQKVIEYVQEAQKEEPAGTVFIIPLLLEQVDLPKSLQSVAWERYFEPDGHEKVVRSLLTRARQLGRSVGKTEEQAGGLPAGSHLPFRRSTQFTGRERELGLLASAEANMVVAGIGGIGKTSLAVEFAYRYGQKFHGVHWLDLRQPSALEAQLALCGSQMDLPAWPETLPQQAAVTLRAWKADGPRLVILDNFRDLKKADEVMAHFQHPALRVLVLTRREEFPKTFRLRTVKLDALSEEESAAYLVKRVPALARNDNYDLRRLARRLGCLPLALELAAGPLSADCPLEEYLKDFGAASQGSAQAELLAAMGIADPTPGDLSLLTAAQVAHARLTDPAPRKVFLAAGYCTPDTAIPPEVFTESLRLDKNTLEQALARLEALDLLHPGEGGTHIHPLLAIFARALDGQTKETLQALADKMAVLAIQANTQVEETGNVQLFVPLRPHIFSVAGYAELASLQDAANLFWNLGYYARIVGDFGGAKSAFERALQIDEMAFGPEHPSVALDASNLGRVLHELGNTVEAKAALEHALNINEAIYGPDHPEVAADVSTLAQVMQDSGDLKGARKAYQRALQIRESAYGPEHISLVPLLGSLAGVQQYLGDLDGTRKAYERALRITEKQRGPEHASLVKLAHQLGVVRQSLGDLTGAREAFERALQVSETVYGHDQPEAAQELASLGSVLQYVGDLHGSKTAFERALKILEETLPPDDPTTRNVRTRLENVEKTLRPGS